MQTPVKPSRLVSWLVGYAEDRVQFLEHGFRFGFDLQYQGAHTAHTCDNLQSARQHLSVLKQKIADEVAVGRVAGPFPEPPFATLRVSPLGLVPKKSPGDFRVIHHLSYPKATRSMMVFRRN